MSEAARHTVTRVRRETRRRFGTVASVERLSPSMLRIWFEGADFHDFESAAPDDHVKLFFAVEGGETAMRDYTPRLFDTAAGRLAIDFALHEAGPATRWALGAKPGDALQIGGPRGSAVVADDFDWYLLIGDETALPAIGRRLEELRPEVPVYVIAVVDGEADCFALPAHPKANVQWSLRSEPGDDAAQLRAAIDDLPSLEGDGYVWIAAEASVARALRAHVVDEIGHPREWVKAAGYWTLGVADAHERIGD